MDRRISLLAAGTILMLAAGPVAASAARGLSGAWTYRVGDKAGCTVTLTSDSDGGRGHITSAANCPGGLVAITHWRRLGQNLELSANSGDLVAVLHSAAHGYRGAQVDGGRSITLTRGAAAPDHVASNGS